MRDSYLTEKQLRVLELRAQGYTQREIAEMLGTTRENVCILESRAKRNIERARRTLIAFESLSPVRVVIEEGESIFSAPHKILRHADMHGIKVVHTRTSIVSLLRRFAGRALQGNTFTSSVEVLVLRSGRLLVRA